MKKLICSSIALICLASSAVSCSSKKESSKDSSKEAATAAATTSADTTASDGASSDSENSIAGKWQCDQIELDGEKTDNLWGADAYALFQIELNEDKSGTFYSFLMSEYGKPDNIEWEKKDDKIQIICVKLFGDEEVYLKQDGDKMILDMSDEDEDFYAYLSKVDTFKEIPEDMEMSLDFEGGVSSDVDISDDNSEVQIDLDE